MTNATIPLANGNLIPTLLYGTAWKKEATSGYVFESLRAGFRGIDTACQPKHYNEPGVGEGVQHYLSQSNTARADLYIQTKFTPISGQDPRRLPYEADAPVDKQVEQSVQASLSNLGTQYLDCLVLHSPVEEHRALPTIWQTMEASVDKGFVKQLGISNCYDLGYLERLCRSTRIKPVVVQNRFYQDSGYDKSLRAFCKQQGIVYQSFWTLTANPHVLEHPKFISLTKQHHCTAPQLLFRYLTLQGVVPLTGTTSLKHMRDDLDIFSVQLNAHECESIETLLN